MHPFTAAGLGQAPFRCVAVRENWFSPPGFPEGRKPGGCCNYCSTGILYEFVIESADNRRFVVGSDCVLKTEAEVSDFKRFRLELAREKRAAGRKARMAAKQAEWAAARAARYVEFKALEPAVCEALEAIDPEAGADTFLFNMADTLRRYGSLTAGQLQAVKGCMARQVQRAAEQLASRFYGELGQRITVDCEILATKEWESDFYPFKTITWTLLKLNGRDFATYKGVRLGKRGDKIKAKFTVKAHASHHGTQQTELARPKVIEEPAK